MTSHYLRCTVKGSFNDIFEALSHRFGNIYATRIGKAESPQNGIILGEQYFFRVNSDVAVLIILEEHSADQTEIEIISYAGGTGLLEISYFAHSAYVNDVKGFLEESGFETQVEEEISYFGRDNR